MAKPLMNYESRIEHEGIIQSADNGNLKVAMVVTSACTNCHARQVCNLADQEIKIVEVFDPQGSYRIGENVKVILTKKDAAFAIFYGYIFPFLVILLTLILSMVFLKNELKAGLMALIVLIPYYFVLYILRNKFKKKIGLQIQKT